MRTRHHGRLLALALFAVTPGAANAQDFGVQESAETINEGNFKFRASPMIVFGRGSAENEVGVAATAGYGFTPRFDVEGDLALYDGVTFFGAHAEYWVVKDESVDVSLTGGLHRRTGDKTATLTGADVIFLTSGHATPRLELIAGLDLAFEGIGQPGGFTMAHFVPGIEYRINEDVDFVAEVGLSLNDRGSHYIAGGLAFYIR